MRKEKVVERFVKAYGALPEAVGSAPGRIEFIGNHTDYNGGLVMGVAIDRGISVALKKRDDSRLCFFNPKTGEKYIVDISRGIEPQPTGANWVNYPLGVLKYMVEAGLDIDRGFNFADFSDLPTGAGLSSSAAIEMSTCMAVASLYNFGVEKAGAVRIGRKSENNFLNMPCGILDQGVSVFGKKDSIVFIDCLSEEFSTCPLPKGCRFALFNSTKKHALVEGLYAERHSECMEAAKALSRGGEERPLRFFGLSALEESKGKMSPKAYMRARHVISENARVAEAAKLLKENKIAEAGKLLYASHESSRTLFENSCEELDTLVDLLKADKNVYGARLSGGGFGGAVMALVSPEFSQADAERVAKKYAEKFGATPKILECRADDGACGELL
ncbi:MAG: galactokinase [Opitutales bacterium]|nr:galactokinase [Opitutales bacterium]